MLSAIKYHEEWKAEQELNANNLIEYLVYTGLDEEAIEILEDYFQFEVGEYNEKISLATFLGKEIMEFVKMLLDNEISFEYCSSDFYFEIQEFQDLAKVLIKELGE